MYQRYSSDWVCAGLYYLRSTRAGKWFIAEVQAVMDDFTITDQDAMQTVLTGYTQVAEPLALAVHPGNRSLVHTLHNRSASGALFLHPLWFEGHLPHENLRNAKNVGQFMWPIRDTIWRQYNNPELRHGFTWTIMSIAQFGNGPVLLDRWEALFSRPQGDADGGGHHKPPRIAGPFLSIHSNCNTKKLLANDDEGVSFLLRPPI